MPVYDLRCTGCGARSEAIVLPGEEMPAECGECGGALKRAWTASPLITLEGWGFSKTDGLVSDARGKDFKALRERADRLRDER